jgi:putative phosphoesterase
MIVGVVSDTHGYVDPRLLAAFARVDAIVHAGDVGGLAVLEALARLAPVHAVRGNNDVPLGGLGLPEHLDIVLGGVPVHVVHERPYAEPIEGTRAVVFGHSHKALAEWHDGTLYLNPGAAGRTGFHRLQTAALLHIEACGLDVQPLELGPREKLPRAPRLPARTSIRAP